MTIHNALYSSDVINRQNVSKKEGESGQTNIKDCVNPPIHEDYIKKNEKLIIRNRIVSAVYVVTKTKRLTT